MEQGTIKRTRNFSLRKIHVGDWIQVWIPDYKIYYRPTIVTAIHDNGTIYHTAEKEHPNPLVDKIEYIDMVPITEEILLGFGFDLREPHFNISGNELKSVYWCDKYIGHLHKQKASCIFRIRGTAASFVHELQELFEYNNMGIELKWKG